MQSVKINCPGCQTTLEVKNPQGLPEKLIKCPKCGKSLKVVFKKPDTDDGGETVLNPSNPNLTSCVLSLGGKDYALNEGVNIIGRKSASSKADIQLDTADAYMSRRHARINIRRLSDSSIRVEISNAENKNATYVNGHILEQEDTIVLHDNDVIRMGQTEVRVKMRK